MVFFMPPETPDLRENITWWPESLTPLEQKRRDFMKEKIDITDEKLWELLDIPGFSSDLDRIMDQWFTGVELTQFLERYQIQVISKTSDGRDFSKLKEEEVDELPRSEQKKYRYWININKDAVINGKDAGVKESRRELEKDLQSLTEEATKLVASLSPEGQAVLQKWVDTVRNNPESEEYKALIKKWVTPEDIASGKANGMLASIYAVRNSDTLSTYVSPDKKKDFENSITNMAGILGIDRKVPEVWRFLQDSMVSWERKEATLAVAAKLVSSWRYTLSETTYDPRSGLITFRGKESGEATRIDTSRIPPVVEYSRNGLSLKSPIENETVSEEQKNRERGLTKISTNLTSAKSESFTPMIQWYGNLIQEKDDVAKGEEFLVIFQRINMENIQDPRKRANTLSIIQNERERVDKIDPSSEDIAIIQKHNDAKFAIKSSIDTFEKSLISLGKEYDELPVIPESRNDLTATTIRETLWKLIDMGYDELWQENLDKLIGALRARDSGRGIWEKWSINTNNTWIREEQIRDLGIVSNLIAEKSGTNARLAFQKIGTHLKRNGGIQESWSKPQKLADWLFNKPEQPSKSWNLQK